MNHENRYDFGTDILDVLIGGNSAIDSIDGLNCKTTDEAQRFLNCYGFNVENPIEKAELFGHYQEALNFIRKNFLYPENQEGLKLEIPRKILEISDPVQLLILSSQRKQESLPAQSLSLWSCAILRIMHTIAHLDKDIRTNYFPDIQKQIMDRFYKFIHNEDDKVFLGKDRRDLDKVDLVHFQSKPKKSRESMILKMLHKSENVAEDIFDRIGVRFVTETQYDGLRVIKFLRDRHVITPANIKPSRSRNTLINIKKLKSKLKDFRESGQTLTLNEIDALLTKACENQTEESSSSNPHTSSDYASIQFTCRQLIKIQNHFVDELKILKNLDLSLLPAEARNSINKIDLNTTQKEIRFFYPFEVQILDKYNHKESEEGRSAHSSYKKNQVQTAMKRVMRGFI